MCLEALAEKGCSGQWTTWTVVVDYYSFQYDCFFFFWDFSCRQRDLSLRWREKSRFRPFYYSYRGLVQEARGNRCHTLIEHEAHPRSCCRRPPPPPSSRTAAVVVNGSYSSWQCCRGLPHGGGGACQYFWRPGSLSIEAFVWGDARLTRDDAVPSRRRALRCRGRCRLCQRRRRNRNGRGCFVVTSK